MATKQKRIRVLMFPWLAHGHISPYLDLAKRLSKRNFETYLCSTPANIASIKPQLLEQYSDTIQLMELHLPSLPQLPSTYHTTRDLPPELIPTLRKAFDMAAPNFSNILKTLNPNLLIYDGFQPWAPELAYSQGIPALIFIITGAAATSFFLHERIIPDGRFPFPAICFSDYFILGHTQNFKSSSGEQNHVLNEVVQSFNKSCDIALINTFHDIEGKYIDYLSFLMKKKVVPIGALIQNDAQEHEKPDIIQWLDNKEISSSVYVSFGSECFLSKEQLEEIAYGLELSKVNFVWVVRFPIGKERSIEEELPRGFLGKVGVRGTVIENWAPQAKILRHPSIGGFVSHCGWNSVMEGIKFGVPIIAVPMQLEQPLNAKIVEEAGVGIEVKRSEDGKMQRQEIANLIREVVLGREGKVIRRTACQLRDKINIKEEEVTKGMIDELVKLSCLK